MVLDYVSADRERSEARVADIELGLTGPDAVYWRQRARDRIHALEQDKMDFGLVAHEVVELDKLIALVGREVTPTDMLCGAFGFALCVAVMVACSLWSPA